MATVDHNGADLENMSYDTEGVEKLLRSTQNSTGSLIALKSESVNNTNNCHQANTECHLTDPTLDTLLSDNLLVDILLTQDSTPTFTQNPSPPTDHISSSPGNLEESLGEGKAKRLGELAIQDFMTDQKDNQADGEDILLSDYHNKMSEIVKSQSQSQSQLQTENIDDNNKKSAQISDLSPVKIVVPPIIENPDLTAANQVEVPCTQCGKLTKMPSYAVLSTNCFMKCASCETPATFANNWLDIILTALYNLELLFNRKYFHCKGEICEFIERHWAAICPGRTRTATWYNTVMSQISTHPELFQSYKRGYWALKRTDEKAASKIDTKSHKGNNKRKNKKKKKKKERIKRKGVAEKLFRTKYRVESILAKRIIRGEVEYYVKWEGYEVDEASWEKASDLLCPILIQDFEAWAKLPSVWILHSKPGAKRRPAKTRKSAESSEAIQPVPDQDVQSLAQQQQPQVHHVQQTHQSPHQTHTQKQQQQQLQQQQQQQYQHHQYQTQQQQPQATGKPKVEMTERFNNIPATQQCHHCRKKRPVLVYCYNWANQDHCRLKYCEFCLETQYGKDTISLQKNITDWICPYCRHVCCCSSCKNSTSSSSSAQPSPPNNTTKSTNTSTTIINTNTNTNNTTTNTTITNNNDTTTTTTTTTTTSTCSVDSNNNSSSGAGCAGEQVTGISRILARCKQPGPNAEWEYLVRFKGRNRPQDCWIKAKDVLHEDLHKLYEGSQCISLDRSKTAEKARELSRERRRREEKEREKERKAKRRNGSSDYTDSRDEDFYDNNSDDDDDNDDDDEDREDDYSDRDLSDKRNIRGSTGGRRISAGRGLRSSDFDISRVVFEGAPQKIILPERREVATPNWRLVDTDLLKPAGSGSGSGSVAGRVTARTAIEGVRTIVEEGTANDGDSSEDTSDEMFAKRHAAYEHKWVALPTVIGPRKKKRKLKHSK